MFTFLANSFSFYEVVYPHDQPDSGSHTPSSMVLRALNNLSDRRCGRTMRDRERLVQAANNDGKPPQVTDEVAHLIGQAPLAHSSNA